MSHNPCADNQVTDTSCIDMTVDNDGVISATPILRPTSPTNPSCATNGLSCTATGLWVDPQPDHIVARCDVSALTLDDADIATICATGSSPITPTMTLVGEGYSGQDITGGWGPVGGNPLVVNFSSVAAGSVLVAHISWGQTRDSGNLLGYAYEPVFSGTATVGPIHTTVAEEWFRWAGGDEFTMYRAILWVEVITGGAGGLTVTFPGASVPPTAMSIGSVYELTDVDPAAPFRQVSSAMTRHDGGGSGTPSKLGSVSLLNEPDCPVYYLGTARHVTGTTTNPGPGGFVSSGTEIQDYVPVDVLGNCQLGLTFGSNSTDQTLTWRSYINVGFGADVHSAMSILELNCQQTEGVANIGTTCVVNLANPACNPSVTPHYTITGGEVCISAAPGNDYEIVLEVNGTDVSGVRLDNSAGVAPTATCWPGIPWDELGATVAPGASMATLTTRLKVRCHAYRSDPQNAITVDGWHTIVDAVHV